jgi:hypothetical protein
MKSRNNHKINYNPLSTQITKPMVCGDNKEADGMWWSNVLNVERKTGPQTS